MKKVYKLSRKDWIARHLGDYNKMSKWDQTLADDLLATKESKPTGNQGKEECKHKWVDEVIGFGQICVKCSATRNREGVISQPEEMREIEKINLPEEQWRSDFGSGICELEFKLNELIEWSHQVNKQLLVISKK